MFAFTLFTATGDDYIKLTDCQQKSQRGKGLHEEIAREGNQTHTRLSTPKVTSLAGNSAAM